VGKAWSNAYSLDVAVDARSRGEGQLEAPRQQRDPGERQVNIGRSRQRHFAFDAERLQIKVGPEEAIEQHHPVGADRFELSNEIAGGGEKRREFHRNRDAHLGFHMTHNVEIALLDVSPAHGHVRGQKIKVELECGGAGLLEFDRIVEPTCIADTVQTGDHRDVERFRRTPQRVDMPGNAVSVVGQFGKIGRCFGMAAGRVLGERGIACILGPDLLLE
jgi:hypothetical protein